MAVRELLQRYYLLAFLHHGPQLCNFGLLLLMKLVDLLLLCSGTLLIDLQNVPT